ncbi:MAG: RNA pseudouridine synthase [Sulfuriflexus sp.]|nr:RNA pseudouridine synthase [Sulfuriflexus sp.]
MNIDKPFEEHIEISEADLTAADVLSNVTSLSKQAVKQAMNKGAIWLTRGKHTQRLRRASRKLNIDDTLHLYYNPEILATEPPAAHLIADEGDYSVWYKPCGLLSQGSKWGDHCTIARWASQHLQPERPAFIVHRLDRAATGLILVAHSKKATVALTKLFQQRDITKQYQAIVQGQFPASPEVLTLNSPIEDRPAVSHVSLIEYSTQRDCSLVNVDIETGRKHQIRRHLSEAGYPILGDRLYGNEKTPSTDLQLTAVSLSFTCPLSNKLRSYVLDNNLRPQL